MTTTISSRGQVVVPAKLRKKYGLRDHVRVAWVPVDQGLLLLPAGKEGVRASRGILKGSGVSTSFLMDLRKGERQREAKKLKSWPNRF